MGYVWKQKIGKIWYLGYIQDLNRPRRSLRTTNEQLAEVIRAKEENDILLAEHGIKQGPIHRIRLSAFIDVFDERKRSERKAPSTLDGYSATLDSFGVFLGRDEFLDKISSSQIELFAKHRRNGSPSHFFTSPRTIDREQPNAARFRPCPKSPKTVRNDLINLKVAFKWAKRQGYLWKDPCAEIELPRRVKQPPRYLRSSDYLALMHAVDAHTAAMEAKGDKQSRRRAEKSKTFKLALQFYLLTGSREDEGCHIRPSRDLDLERMILRIPMPKTRTQKVIPIESELESVIRQLLDRADGRDQLINIPADSLYHTFKKFAAAAGLDPKFTFHSLRHTAASWLAAEGVGFRQVQDFLGHADAQSTQIYIHSLGDELRSQIGKLRLPREEPAAEGEKR